MYIQANHDLWQKRDPYSSATFNLTRSAGEAHFGRQKEGYRANNFAFFVIGYLQPRGVSNVSAHPALHAL
jgi:hypothetical protein